MKKIVTTIMVIFAVGCGDAEAKDPVTEIQSTPNIVIVPNTDHIDYSAYNREWRKANNMPALRWTSAMQAKVKVTQDPEHEHEIVEIELDNLKFREAFRLEFLGKGEGHTFWWRGNEYTTNLIDVVRKPGLTNDDPYIERVHKEVIVPVSTEGNTKEGTTTK